MRAFIVLCCLATAYAASLGYDYERQSGGGSSTSGGIGGGEQSYQTGPAGGSYGGGEQSHQSGADGGSHGANDYTAPAEFTKEFFSFSAPDGAFDDNIGKQQLANSLKRALRVIFIKGPESSGLENAALQLAKSAGEQKTAIYVLNKQADIGDLANKLNALNKNSNNKPEVNFVKYRTAADAENAKHAIQSQYESLGGKSSSHNGGVAPVLDFASKAPVSSGYQTAEPVSSYLPASKRV